MDITTPFLTVQQLALVPVALALVSAAKVTGLPSQYAPITAILVGIGMSFLMPAATLSLTVLAGLVIGLGAAGLYSGTKAVVQG